MRADAQRNAQKLRAAAAELFHERGLQAPLKEIARRAGVSHGTLYNLFGSREALIDEVVTDLAAGRLDAVAEEALAREDAWDGFAYYIEKLCEMQLTDPVIADVVTGRYPGAARLMAVCERARVAAVRIIERAQRSGALRPDFTNEDLLFVFAANAQLSRAAKDTAPDAWRRGVALALDGLRTEAAHPLPAAPLTPQQFKEVMSNLAGTA
ncbi:TetR/AcrR family transcriptional regulator [Streptomyces ipomoeae]|jgi:AcrR family transcriptional regulator|uniref:Transcriptional regulator, TetR family n=2 Tax=Streptomyces ipomoeae TaxID=103232 RepID=L1KRS0_9ACTN|nr:TetR/AcrR family transcriptional regulator [Streptomyces ipomoeae]EKX63292.1 transcriptional regulator, TetR family [Streptomyces ipomoeae 91-03]MDX2697780.1 helix-turn-helix domain containing protein [Streptomyces ipomoeae]MDX2822579.1 helix-turn-helix domain containing protein [Streptomyces ipomoeae]MDX2844057.1 helix-turn-helix domain containing protein [Streptomyces ipomoeae]MDX2877841.1 helix-turn-helix domain containing protein [Streptomyces ipomoeae]